jgi:hypothetical protein
MRYFLLPYLLVTIGSADIEQAVLKYLAAHYPLSRAEYTCDLLDISLPAVECDSVAVDGFGRHNLCGRSTVRLSFYRFGQRMQAATISVRIGLRKPMLVSAAKSATEAVAAFAACDFKMGIPQGCSRQGSHVDFIPSPDNFEAAADITQVVGKDTGTEIVDEHVSIAAVGALDIDW